MLTSTFFFAIGLGLIALAIFLRFHPSLVPSVIQPVFDRFIPRLPYFVTAFGLLSLGQARSMVASQYTAAQRKNKQFPHAWKIPLIVAQAFILQFLGFIYAFIVGVGWIQPIKSLMGLLSLLFLFMIYVLWYIIAHVQNHFPSIAALRVAMLALIIAAISFGSWTALQTILISLLIGLFALFTALASIGISSGKTAEQRGGWLQVVCLLATVIFLIPVAVKAFSFGEARTQLVNLKLADNGIVEKADSLCYSTDSKKIAFAEKTGDQWFIQMIWKENEDKLDAIKIRAGEGNFHCVFIQGGKFLLIDPVKNGERGIWKINSENGYVTVLRRQGVEPFGDGTPWSEQNGQFLYVSHSEGLYQLNALTLETGKSKILMTSGNPILTPSWTDSNRNVAYADGIHSLFYILNVDDKEKNLHMSDVERSLGEKFVPEGKVDEVVPAPDGFRYLYLTHEDKSTAIWLVRTDGSHRDKLYETNDSIKNVTWHPDGQKIIFEEKYGRLKYWFINQPSGIRILDANVGTIENLIPPKFPTDHPPFLLMASKSPLSLVMVYGIHRLRKAFG